MNNNLENIFDRTWKANNYKLNGVKEKMEEQKKSFNRMYGIVSKEEIKKAILNSNSFSENIKKQQNALNKKYGIVSKEEIKGQEEEFNKKYGIVSKEEIKKEILKANSIQGRIDSLNKSMQGLKSSNRNGLN